MILYLFQVFTFQFAFLLMYNFFFQKETFYAYNRFYLLLTPILSIILPAIRIESLNRHIPSELVLTLTSTRDNIDASIQQVQSITLQNVLITLWAIGSLFFLIRFIYKYYQIRNVIKTNNLIEDKEYNFVELTNSTNAYSFFNYIFLGDNLNNSQRDLIKKHEIIHAQSRHSYDIIYYEFLKILFWFNPINYIMNRKLKALHEFSVDSKLTKKKGKNAFYQSLLSQIFDVEDVAFVNPFFRQSLIKNRIIMLQKSKSKRIFMMKYILLIPALSFMLVYTSCKAQSQSKIINGVESLKQSIAESGNITDEEMKSLKVLYALTMEDGLTNPLLEDVRDDLDIPSGVLPQFPVFPGCDGDNAILRSCMADKLVELIQSNLSEDDRKDFDKMESMNLTFRLDTKGKSSRATLMSKNKDINTKVERIVNTKLPIFQPSIIQNVKVGVRVDLMIK